TSSRYFTLRLRRGKRVILNLAAQAETLVNMFHALDRDMALQSEERFRRAETFSKNNNLALQVFTGSKWLFGDAIESFAAEILCGAFNRCRFSLPPKTHRPMHCNPFAFPTR